MQRFQKISKKVSDKFSESKSKLVAVGVAGVAMASNASADVTMPTPDYGNIESAFTTGAGVVLTVSLLYAAFKFLKAK